SAGNCCVAGKIMEIENRFSPFDVSLKNVGAFPSTRKARILWVGIEEGEDNLIELFKAIDNKTSELGFEKEGRKFIPHITFGRVKKGKYSLTENIEFSFHPFPVKEITLFKSTLTPKGAIYETISAIPLRGDS
ncbi:MAG: RNA 2',3'-cyclic phosphodiesterase, partial [candidate division WOR-3 bacterium]